MPLHPVAIGNSSLAGYCRGPICYQRKWTTSGSRLSQGVDEYRFRHYDIPITAGSLAAVTPEPSTVILTMSGLAALAGFRRRLFH